MTDLAIRFDAGAKRLDLIKALSTSTDNGFVQEVDIETAVLASIFTWARADADDELPGFDDDRKGYWGDDFQGRGRKVGSKLWLLARAVNSAETRNLARVYISDALNWLIEDGFVTEIDIRVVVPHPTRADFFITLGRPQGGATRIDIKDLFNQITV